ncbi:hypothetical protein [Actinokineospora sp. NPDC004072]
MTYYPPPPGPWAPPFPPHPRPSGGTAITAGVFALLLLAFAGWNIFWQAAFVLDGCGFDCLTGVGVVPFIGFPLASLLLLAGAIMTFARVVAGPVLAAIGAFLVLAMLLMFLVLSGGYVNALMILGFILALVTLVMSLLPPTFAWTRAPKPAFAPYPPPMPYPPRY